MTYVLSVTVPVVTAQDIAGLKKAAGRLSAFVTAPLLDTEKAAGDYAVALKTDSVNRSSQNSFISGVKSVTKSADGGEWTVELSIFD
jgi:hypothetical protein